MPRIIIRTNTALSYYQQKNMTEGIRRIIEKIPGEKAEYVMSEYEPSTWIHFGDDLKSPCASIEVVILDKVFKRTDPDILETVLKDITELITRNCGIPGNRIYGIISTKEMWTFDGTDIRKTFLKD